MALEATLKYAVRRIAQVFRDYGIAQGWTQDDYQLFVHLNPDWGRIHLVLVVRAWPENVKEDPWFAIVDYLEGRLKDDPALFNAINLVVQTRDQVAEGGIYRIGPQYTEVEDLLASGTTT
jgi:hypothetical protein